MRRLAQGTNPVRRSPQGSGRLFRRGRWHADPVLPDLCRRDAIAAGVLLRPAQVLLQDQQLPHWVCDPGSLRLPRQVSSADGAGHVEPGRRRFRQDRAGPDDGLRQGVDRGRIVRGRLGRLGHQPLPRLHERDQGLRSDHVAGADRGRLAQFGGDLPLLCPSLWREPADRDTEAGSKCGSGTGDGGRRRVSGLRSSVPRTGHDGDLCFAIVRGCAAVQAARRSSSTLIASRYLKWCTQPSSGAGRSGCAGACQYRSMRNRHYPPSANALPHAVAEEVDAVEDRARALAPVQVWGGVQRGGRRRSHRRRRRPHAVGHRLVGLCYTAAARTRIGFLSRWAVMDECSSARTAIR